MAQLYFENLTAPNGAVMSLKQLFFLETLSPDALGSLFSIVTGVHKGDKVGLIGEFGKVGKKSTGCSPVYEKGSLANSEKEWDLQEWSVPISLCYTDLQDTLAKYDMKTGSEIFDLDGPFMTQIFIPKLEEAIKNLVLRLAWFGDKSAASVADGGIIKSATDVDYYNVTDGIWKQIKTLVASDSSRRVVVDANTKTTFAEQQAAIRVAGVATGIIDDLIESADPVLRDTGTRGMIYTTLMMKDALDRDIRNNNKGSNLQWQSIFNGVQTAMYNGVTLMALPFLDNVIKHDEGVTGNAKWNNPYRAIYTIKDNLQVGTEGTDAIGNLDITPDNKDRMMYVYCASKMGTMIPQDNLIQVAY